MAFWREDTGAAINQMCYKKTDKSGTENVY